MPTWGWIVIAVLGAIIVLGALALAWRAQRSQRLRKTFGPEYDRVAADAPSRREAESELLERKKHHDELEIRPLDPEQRDRYLARWQQTQARFVDDPEGAVVEADRLIQEVMRERGYPVDDFDTRANDLSVDYPDVVQHYRAAHGVAVAQQRGRADTEDLRQAVKHYRALFENLVSDRDREEVRR
jgi:hypothetical protein